ncbi:MAG: hypothetical protein AAF348_07475 [Bacteroidota bacterium]
MSERTNNIEYYLSDNSGDDPVLIEEIKNFQNIGGDEYSLEEGGHIVTEKTEKVTMYQKAYEYLLGKYLFEGVNAEVRFITRKKDDLRFTQDWKTVSNPSVGMSTLVFNEENDTRSVEVGLVQDTLLQNVKARWEDDFDVTAEDYPELPYVNVRLDPRQILKRSRFVASDQEVEVIRDQGDTARAVPLNIDYTSDRDVVNTIFNIDANSVGGGYADLATIGNTIIWNVPRDLIYTLNGTVRINVTQKSVRGDYFRMDLVKYTGGEDQNYDSILQAMGQIDPTGNTTNISYTFNDYEVVLNQGDSVGIMILTDADNFSGEGNLKFRVDESTELILRTDTPFPVTYTKAVRPEDMFKHLSRIATEKEDLSFLSTLFSSGQKHENKLLVHGTWLRNMPQILNEGEDDERRLQAELSLQDLYEAYSIIEPLRYDAKTINNKETFIVGSEKDIQQNFTAIQLGETTDKFRLVEPSAKSRNIIGESHYGFIKIGSETSGSNYGQVNNLYSTSGFAKWGTINKLIKEGYEVTTDFRTGAEDVELQRSFQWEDNPDIDGEYDNDWFLLDCKRSGSEYVLKKWQDYYEVEPQNVYSAETNYNWGFSPIELLRGHGYKINSALDIKPTESLNIPVGNCNLSLITRKSGENSITHNKPFPHTFFERPRVRLIAREFEMIIGQEVVDMLRGETEGVDNKFGLIEHLWNGELVKSRIIEVQADTKANFKLIEAVV